MDTATIEETTSAPAAPPPAAPEIPAEELARRAALPPFLRAEPYLKPFANAPRLNALGVSDVEVSEVESACELCNRALFDDDEIHRGEDGDCCGPCFEGMKADLIAERIREAGKMGRTLTDEQAWRELCDEVECGDDEPADTGEG